MIQEVRLPGALADAQRLANDDRAAGRYADAEARLLTAIEAASHTGRGGDVCVAMLRNDLAVVYKYLGRLDEAEVLYRQALRVLDAALGGDHPEVATVLHNLGGIAHAKGQLRSG